jgi:hypothetical protein
VSDDFPEIDFGYHKGLFQITDKLRRLNTDPGNLNFAEYNALLGELCGSLTKTLENGFATIARAAAGLTNVPGRKEEALAVLRDAGTFARFIEFENSALVKCGMSIEAAQAISADIVTLRAELSKLPFEPELAVSAVQKCRDDVCAASQKSLDMLTALERRYWFTRRVAVASGAVTIISNALAITVTAGAATPFVVLSTAGGSALIAAQTMLGEPGKLKPG